MGRRTRSNTKRDSFLLEHLAGGHHYKTTISNGRDRVVRRGHTPRQSQYRASKSWGQRSGGGKSSGGCYLTTACAEAMHLPDNCLELSILRNFRDKVLLPTSIGKEAVEEYYEIAPEIVEVVNERSNVLNIWHSVYADIRKAISLITRSDFEGAFKHYKEMTLRLKKKYLD